MMLYWYDVPANGFVDFQLTNNNKEILKGKNFKEKKTLLPNKIKKLTNHKVKKKRINPVFNPKNNSYVWPVCVCVCVIYSEERKNNNPLNEKGRG